MGLGSLSLDDSTAVSFQNVQVLCLLALGCFSPRTDLGPIWKGVT